MDKFESNIGNCPHCTKVIFKNGAFTSNASFTMRCPSCQKLLEIEVRTKIEITIRPSERYLLDKKIKLGKLSVIFGFTMQPLSAHCMVCIICIAETCGCICCQPFFI